MDGKTEIIIEQIFSGQNKEQKKEEWQKKINHDSFVYEFFFVAWLTVQQTKLYMRCTIVCEILTHNKSAVTRTYTP